MNTYCIKNVFESRRGIGLDVFPDDICSEIRTFYVSPSFIKQHCIVKGMSFDEVLYSQLEEEHLLRIAVFKAADILAGGDYSTARLQRKLTEKGISRETAEKAALYMEERGYIREAESAQRAARFMLESKMRGKKRIMADLLAKGYKKVAVQSAVNSISREEYYEALCRNLNSKYKAPAVDRREKEKRVAAMMRQGFDAGDILKAMNEGELCQGDF